MSDWTSEYMQLIEDCEVRSARLTDWENTFVDSLRNQLAAGRRLSQKQIDTLDEIWEKATERG
jgi:hypothetical protein